MPEANEGISKDARTWAMLCHLAGLAGYVIPVILSGILAPLIVWQIKKEEDPFIDENGKEAVNFQISMGILTLAVVAILDLVCLIIASVKANNGEHYRYPLCIRFIK